MSTSAFRPVARRTFSAGVLGAAALAVAPAAIAAPGGRPGQPGPGSGTDPVTGSLTAVPEVRGPIAENAHSHMFSTMEKAKVPFDVRDYGYAETEFFLSGTANVYDRSSGSLEVVTEAVPYVNRILVRHPVSPSAASGVVLVDILNASNGYDVEDHWRRLWDHAMAQGHTVIGVTSKPLQVDALKIFDPERYANLTWDLDPRSDRELVRADPEHPEDFDPFMVVEGAEEGLAWDIITQLGNLLRSRQARRILGGAQADTLLLLGQSQSGIYLNTYSTAFHELAAVANGRPVFDGYLNSVGAVLERGLRQAETGGLHAVPGSQPDLGVPHLTVTSEGDAGLFGLEVLAATELPATRRHWQVPGTPHTDVNSPVSPADDEVYASARLPRLMDQAFIDALNPYPLEPSIIAATEALIAWVQDVTEAAPSLWYDQRGGELVRDEHGNVTGGVRYGLLDHPLAAFRGASEPGSVFGSYELISADEFRAAYGTRDAYLDLLEAADDDSIRAGYLTRTGAEKLTEVALGLLDEIGV